MGLDAPEPGRLADARGVFGAGFFQPVARPMMAMSGARAGDGAVVL